MFIINSESNFSQYKLFLIRQKNLRQKLKKNQFDIEVSYKKHQTSLPPRSGRHWIQFGCGLRLLMRPTAQYILDNQNQCS